MAHVVGLLVSAVVSAVGNKLGSVVGDEVTMLWGFKDDLEDMKSTLEFMKAALKDAERRSVGEESVRLWLKRLKKAAYDISDVLDEFQPSMTGKMACLAIVHKITMAHKIQKLRGELRKIKEDHESFRFAHDSSLINDAHQFPYPRVTASKVIESLITGRDKDRKNVLALLPTSNTKEDTIILGICGIGGVGKTTLAQLVFNDTQFKDYDYRVWVYVSEVFDLKKIGNSIISQVGKEGNYQNEDTMELINQRLQHLLQNKKTLIVLDDLWETNYSQLNELKLMLNVRSKMEVLVTTRNEEITTRICTSKYKLDPLDNDMCWSIIKQSSDFESRADKEQLEQVGKDIAKKCGGLPLAAKALGFLLYGKNLTEWNAVSNSDIWDEPFSGNTVLPSLKLSYKALAPYLRLCFAYCAIFPKGHNIRKDILIHHWIALDFIEPSNIFSAIQLGDGYVRQFLGMSFLQHSKLHRGYHAWFTMHDLVHDLARSVIDEELIVFDATRVTSARRQEYCRYALLANYSGSMNISTILPAKLRALHLLHCSELKLHGGAFSFIKCLRVLDLTEFSVGGELKFPSSIGQLKQLRFLICPKLQDKIFPKSITQLSKLQYLDLHGSHQISGIPSSISKLECLMHLDLSYCCVEVIPEALCGLTKLQYLDLSECKNLKSLPESLGNLINLQTLNLLRCWDLKSLPESLGNLINLPTLDLSYCSNLKSLPESLGNLINLHTLHLSACQNLESLPESLGNLKNLPTLDLSYCSNLKSLPESLGNLINLHRLDLSSCWDLKSLPESLGNLINLHTLDLSDCWYLLESLPESLGNLKNLHTLDLSRCRNLKSLPQSLGNLINLHTLDLSCCWDLKSLPESLRNLINLHTLDLSFCTCLKSLPENLGNLINLHTLHLSHCLDLKSLPESLENLKNLHTLDLSFCQNLKSLPERLENLKNLHTLDLSFCQNLKSLPESIGSIDSLEFIHIQQYPYELRELIKKSWFKN